MRQPCLSALYRAEPYHEIVELVGEKEIWPYKSWAVKALAAMGKKSETIRSAEASRGSWTSDSAVDRLCEEIVLSSGLADEAYRRYGLRANRAGTYLATFRAVARNYPHKSSREILHDLVQTTPGDEGKWLAAVSRKVCTMRPWRLAVRSADPYAGRARTGHATARLRDRRRAARAALARQWVRLRGNWRGGRAAYSSTITAAVQKGNVAEVRAGIRQIISVEGPGGFVKRVLGREFGM